jgi:HEAT repeat protein
MRVRDYAWEKRLDNKWGRTLLPRRWFNKAFISHLDAAAGFSMLGTQAVVVLPEFSKMAFDTNNSPNPAYALGYFGPEAWPVLREALTNVNQNIAFRSVLGITATPEMARLALPEMPTLWSSLDPSLADFLALRFEAVLPKDETLGFALPFLKNPSLSMQANRLRWIAANTNDLAKVVPMLLQLVKSKDLVISMEAESLLYRIDPTAANARGTNANLYKSNSSPK